jgi:Ca-activated chloride channel family protein
MNASNQTHDPPAPDDLPDRLVDLALSELIGGNTPPDLSSGIAAATFRQPAAIGQVPRTRQQDRAFWVNLAIAVMLLIGVTVVLLFPFRAARENSSAVANVAELAKQLQNHHDASKSVPAASTTPQSTNSKATIRGEMTNGQVADNKETSLWSQLSSVEKSKVERTAAKSADLDSLTNLVQSTPATNNFEWDKATAAPTLAPSVSLDVSGPQGRPEVYTKAIGRLVEPEELNKSKSVAGTGLQSARPADALSAYIEVAPKPEAPRPGFTIQDRYAADNNTLAISAGDGVTRDAIVGIDGTKQLREKEVAQIIRSTEPNVSGDKYTQIVENPFIKAEGGAAVSTFSIDVDTASYANVRQFLLQMNQLPPPDAVRIEELINYFHYDYAGPGTPAAPVAYNTTMATAQVEAASKLNDAPFAAHVEVTGCPWAPEHRLARIGIKGREMDRNKRPQSNLVFLVDVSGSMNEPAKLPLVVYGLEQLTHELGENDHIAIVVYAGTEGLVLPSTSGSKQDTILAALAKLEAGGSTAGGAGIQLAYQIAEDNFIKGGTNRVILCTDGDFNVGVTDTGELQRMVEKKAKDTGVFISTLGFGRGNLNDAMMVAISDHGNGNYHYIDNRTEARRVLVEEMTGTLVTIAKDVKIQVEFNPAQVAGYRLIGYEKRALRTEDFNDDKKDAGEIGAGHTVTALYEIVPAGKKTEISPVDDLKYQKRQILLTDGRSADSQPQAPADASRELLTLKMRYKAPDGDTSKKLEWPITDDGKSFAAASGDLKFAASVASFGLLLRNSQYKGNLTYAATLELAKSGIGEDPHGYRKEFLDMVRKAKELRHE